MTDVIRRSKRRSVGALAVLLLLAGGFAVATAGSSGADKGDLIIYADNGSLRYRNSSDGSAFIWENPAATTNSTQTVNAGGNCIARFAGDDLVVTSAGGNTTGFIGGSLGVFSGGSRGTPCSVVSGGEQLTIALGADLASSRVYAARFDLEVKGSAIVHAVFTDGTTTLEKILRTGTAADGPIDDCPDGADSGPDARSRDNCIWNALTVQDAFAATSVTLSAEQGEFSVEGGGDWVADGFGPIADYDTRFLIGKAFVSEGELPCNSVLIPAVDGSTNDDFLKRLDNLDPSDCVLLDYRFDTENAGRTVTFRKNLLTETDAVFNLDLTWPVEQRTGPAPLTTIDYEVAGLAPQPIGFCPKGGYKVPNDPSTDWVISATDLQGLDVVPGGAVQFACVFFQEEQVRTVNGVTGVQVRQRIYLVGDPLVKR